MKRFYFVLILLMGAPLFFVADIALAAGQGGLEVGEDEIKIAGAVNAELRQGIASLLDVNYRGDKIKLLTDLISKGLDKNLVVDRENARTLLMRLVLDCTKDNGYQELIEILLGEGSPVKVNAIDRDGKTALHHAVMGDNDGVVELLLAAGINKSIQDNDGCTALERVKRVRKGAYCKIIEALETVDERYQREEEEREQKLRYAQEEVARFQESAAVQQRKADKERLKQIAEIQIRQDQALQQKLLCQQEAFRKAARRARLQDEAAAIQRRLDAQDNLMRQVEESRPQQDEEEDSYAAFGAAMVAVAAVVVIGGCVKAYNEVAEWVPTLYKKIKTCW